MIAALAWYVAGIFTGFAIIFGWGLVQAIRREMTANDTDPDWATESRGAHRL